MAVTPHLTLRDDHQPSFQAFDILAGHALEQRTLLGAVDAPRYFLCLTLTTLSNVLL